MDSEILVIGSGIAGLSFALKASEYAFVVLVTKDKISESNTKYAQGGLAAVSGEDDSFELHVKDTLRAGDGLCDKEAVEFLVKNAPSQIEWLRKIGVEFDSELSNEAVHSAKRIVHSGDITGERVSDVLVEKVKASDRIKVFEGCQAVELVVEDGKCVGCDVLDVAKGDVFRVSASGVVLATGGLGRVFKNTCNPEIATGDGFALAFNAGAELIDMEFVQFHPTGLYGSDPIFLISETLRGEGGHLRNKDGEIYMLKYHRDGELAPRDVVSKFSVDEMKRTGTDHVFLDLTHMDSEYLVNRFPKIHKKCLEYGVDLTKDKIPVAPTAHYSCGGVKIDLNGCSSVPGLYAIGEVSCSGLHGADRLASNSLTEGLVFGESLSEYLKDKVNERSIELKIIKNDDLTKKNINNKISINNEIIIKIKEIKEKIQSIMWEKVGIIRSEKDLSEALEVIKEIEEEVNGFSGVSKELVELKNLILVSKVITFCALRRKESRGTHFISEYAVRDDKEWANHLVVDKESFQ
ncbi:MAG: L-aspartate oxidase [Candidatus Woesearchaeota archaeon]|jgi:L-aspartate oxidase|nr:L-aspartate oxidase [Candidatus Woesearchaeota archaeon]MDP7323856.1 L-aspartate oxidase [Candidatus Woesearchaeota archaeon]